MPARQVAGLTGCLTGGVGGATGRGGQEVDLSEEAGSQGLSGSQPVDSCN